MKIRIPLAVAGLLFVLAASTVSAQPFPCDSTTTTCLDVIPAAQIGGSAFGMRVAFSASGQQNAFVRDDSPACEKDYWATFNVRATGLSMANGTGHLMFRGREPGVPSIFLAQAVRDFGGNQVIYVLGYHDDGSFAFPAIADFMTQNRFTIEWHQSTGVDTNDGIIRLYKGTNLVGEVTNLDNDTFCIEFVEMGAFGGIDATTTGEIHFDEFMSTRVPQF